MSNQKFFSGLTEGMMKKHSDRPDRQKSSIFWPPEMMQEDEIVYKKQNHLSRRIQKQREEEENASKLLKERQRKQLNSNIEFYDDIDSANTNTVENKVPVRNKMENYSRENSMIESEEARNRKFNTLTSKIRFYDFDESASDPTKKRATIPKEENGHHHHQQQQQQLHTNNNEEKTVEYNYSSRYTGTYNPDDTDDHKHNNRNKYGNGDVMTHTIESEIARQNRSMSLSSDTSAASDTKKIALKNLTSSINFFDGP